MEELSCCKGEKEADQVYLAFMKQLKEQGTSLESAMLEPSLLKLEVAYLRRKL